MKLKPFILWIIALVIIDQTLKIIINAYFLESQFVIIKSLLEIKPVFSDLHSYPNALLNYYFGINVGLLPHLIIFAIGMFIMLSVYLTLKKIEQNRKLLDCAFILLFAAFCCALIGNLIWKKGTLDFIYTKPFPTVDMKDLYVNCFVFLFLIYVFKNYQLIKNIKFKNIINIININLFKNHLKKEE